MKGDITVKFHPHALERMKERGAAEHEIILTVKEGRKEPARLGRWKFDREFEFDGQWQGRKYSRKRLEVIAVIENSCWTVITVAVKFY